MPSAVSNEIQDVARRAQAGVLEAIPQRWRLPAAQLELAENANVMDIPVTCGILTPDQIAITEQTATELLAKLTTGKLSSVEVTEAFCARAAIAHQLVRSSLVSRVALTDFADQLYYGVLSRRSLEDGGILRRAFRQDRKANRTTSWLTGLSEGYVGL